jgi:hypothetical protein
MPTSVQIMQNVGRMLDADLAAQKAAAAPPKPTAVPVQAAPAATPNPSMPTQAAAPLPTDSNQPMEPYDPFGPVSNQAQSAYSGPPLAPMEPYDSFPGWAGQGYQNGGYDPATVNMLNDTFVAAGLSKDKSSGGIGSDWVSGGTAGRNALMQGQSGGSWDPQGVAANIASGSPNIPPALAAANLNRYANAFQNFGGFKNPNAGFAASTVAGAESGGNPYAVNQAGSGATGMNQWMNGRLVNMQNLTAGNMSPEMQAAFAASEIMGGGYPGVYNALNNPNTGLTGMQGPLIDQFEGLGGDPRQAAIDRKNATKYAQGSSPFNNTLRNNVIENAGINP